VVMVVTCNEILHDTARLEETDVFPIGESVGHAWDTAIGVDGEKLWCLLVVLGNIDLVRFV